MEPTISIVIVTRNRPDMINRCLENVYLQKSDNSEVIIVDASTNHTTRDIIKERYPETKYIYLKHGQNNRHLSKNIGIRNASGKIIAFLDDDSIIQDGWMEACLNSFSIADIGGVGGVIKDTNASTEIYSTDEIGKVTFNGTRVGNFHKDPGKIIEVDHLRGCNMSFRKDVLEHIDGFDLNYTGSNVLEETDLSVRVKKAGYKVIFNPSMRVLHTAAAREVVFRETFTLKREFYIARNSTYFMMVNFGIYRAMVYILTNDTGIVAFLKKPGLNSFCCIFVFLYGKIVGFFVGLKKILDRMKK